MSSPRATDCGCDLGSALARGAESHATGFDVGTRDVYLDCVNGGEVGEPLGDGLVVGDGSAGDVDDNLGAAVGDKWVNVLDEMVDALVLEPDGVNHTGGSLDHAWGVIALARVEGSSLDDEAAEAGEVDEVGVFDAVTECAGGGEDGIFEPQAIAEVNAEI